MRRIFKMFVFLTFIIPVYEMVAQTPSWIWVRTAGSIGSDYCSCIKVDESGNSYIAGGFSGTVTFGSESLTSLGGWDIFVAKIDISGNWIWARRAGGVGTDSTWDIGIDSSGNIYTTGFFQTTAEFGSSIVTSTGSEDVFVSKLDTNGNWLWARRAGSPSSEYYPRIAVDPFGNCYLTGRFEGNADFGSSVLTGGEGSIYFAKIDSGGNWLYANVVTGEYVRSYGIAINSQNEVIIAGRFSDIINFGTISLTTPGATYGFVAAASSNGTWLWAQSNAGTGSVNLYDIAIDNNNNIFITGNYINEVSFGETSFSSPGERDVYVAKLDPSGNNWLWAVSAGSTSNDYAYNISTDNSGACYVNGNFTGIIDFGNTSVSSSVGNYDMFVSKLNSSGICQWAEVVFGDGDEELGGMDVYNSDCIVSGGFSETTAYGNTPLTSNGSYDIVVAKLGFSTTINDPPETPENLTISVVDGLLVLNWDDVNQDVLGNPIIASYYEVFKGDTPGFVSNFDSLIANVTQSYYELDDVVDFTDRMFFKVIAHKE